MIPYNLAGTYRSFGQTCCLHVSEDLQKAKCPSTVNINLRKITVEASTAMYTRLSPLWDDARRTLIVTVVSGQPVFPIFQGQGPGQDIPRILWNLKFHQCVYSSLQLVHIPSQTNPLPALSSDLTSILNIILPSRHRCSMWFISLGYLHRNPACISSVSHACHLSCLSHSS